MARIVLGAIPEAKRGLPGEELAQRVLIGRRMSPDDKKLAPAVAKRVSFAGPFF